MKIILVRMGPAIAGLLMGLLPVHPGWTQETAGAAPDVVPGIPPVEDLAMIRVGADTITVRQYLSYINGSTRLVELANTDEGRNRVLEEMAGKVLLHQAMQAEGLIAPDDASKRRLQNAFLQLEKRHFPLPPEPDEATLRKYYEDHPESFGIPPMVRISHIQFKLSVNSSDERRERVRKRAEEVLARLEKGAVFADMAKEASDNKRTSALGGDAGFLDANTPWLKTALSGIGKGDRTGVVESPAGLEIIQVTDRREAMVIPFEQVRPEVVKQWSRDQQQQAKDNYIHELAQKTEIEALMEEVGDINL